MKTIINEHGCTTHPHGEPMLEVNVPLIVNGCGITEQLTQLAVANLNTSMKIEELEQTVVSLQAILKTLQETFEANFKVMQDSLETKSIAVENSISSEEISPAVKSGRKSTKSNVTETNSTTTV